MRLMFVLSGEHPTLPVAEIRGAIKGEGGSYEILEEHDQVLILETEIWPSKLADRLAMTREICLHLCTSNVDETLEAVASTDLPELLSPEKTFAVRVKRVRGHCPNVHSMDLEKKLADIIFSEFELKVNLDSPEQVLVGILTNGKCCVGLRLMETVRPLLKSRKPTARAAFHPSTMSPILARCMINLARTPRGGTLCDPFCGVGGILVEAGLMGIKPLGFDIDPKMVSGAIKNLEYFGIKNFSVEVGNALELQGIKVDSVVTEPPFGIQSSTWGVEAEELFRRALRSIANILKDKGFACISTPHWLRLERDAEEEGLQTVEVHEQYVHRSLTRRIYVFKKTPK